MSVRSAVGLAVIATFTFTACDEFPEPLESDSGVINVTVSPVDWPAELVLGGSADLEVEVLDRQGRRVLEVPVDWSLEAGSAGTLRDGTEETSAGLSGTSLGWARITVTVTDDDRFSSQPLRDSVPILLAGVVIQSPAADTTLTAVGDEVTLSARGVSLGGNAVPGTGLTWELVSGSSVSAVSSTSADQVTVQASGEGESVIAATHTLCVSTSPCADTIRVTVDQVADSVALQSRADTLIAEDTVTLNATAYDVNNNAAPNETFTWTSRNPAVATVNASGQVTAQGTGQTYVVVTAGTGADSAAIEVSGSGTMTVDLTDAPADNLQSAMLYLSGVYITDAAVANGRRYVLDAPFSVDLLTLADTVTALGAVRVPVGTYSNVWLAVDSAVITLRAGLAFADATTRRSFVPDPDTVAAAINGTATFADGDSVGVVLDFDVDGSFPMSEPSGGVVGEPTFDPTTRAVKRTQAASIAGTVGTTGAVSVENLPVRAVRTDLVRQDTIYTRTDAGGAYKFRYLSAGSYDLSLPRPPACHVPTPALQTVAPTAGQALTAVNFSVDSVTIDSVSATPAATINAIGFTTTVSATAYQGTTALAGLGIEYSSADPGIATVDAVSGQVTAVSTGVARIAATACGSTDTSLVTVQQIAASATIAPQDTAIEAGDSVQYTAELLDSAGVVIPSGAFEFSSLDTNIASIDLATGWATGLKSGSVTIEAFEFNTGISASTVLSVLLAPTTSFSMSNYTNGCAVTTTGQVVCWGPNPHGILGFTPILDSQGGTDWTTPYGPQEIPLPGGEMYVQVSTGYAHACALTGLGDIYCWGSGGSGELGNGSNFDSHTPVLVQRPAGETFTDVAAGNWMTCAATQSGQAYCWGDNGVGQLGNGTTNATNVPTAVSQVSGLLLYDLTVGDRTVCAIGTNDAGYCWGEGHRGDLGNGNASDSFTPVGVNMPATTFTEIVSGIEGMCALGGNGIIYCWGEDTPGINSGTDMLAPQPVGSETFVTIGRSNQAVCGATATGQVRCTGGNYHGQFGNGTINRGSALFENGATGISATALDGAGYDTMCGLDAGGKVFCWGWKEYGVTGTGDIAYTKDPMQLSGPTYTAVASEWDETCALTEANEVYCWGYDVGSFNGDFGYPNLTPQLVTSPPAGVIFTDIDKGINHMCALTTDGQIFCLGENYTGQLGDGSYNSSLTAWVPVVHPGGGTWSRITSGREYNCALDTFSDVYCWGFNGNGQLGTGPGTSGSGANFNVPTITSEVSQAFTSVSAGNYHTCATTTSSSIFCWGWNGRGQLGVGNYTDRDTPTQVVSGEFFSQVDAGAAHSCGLNFSGQAYCWGSSGDGEIGDDFGTSDPTTPVAASGGFAYDWIRAEHRVTCGKLQTGGTKCWGQNWGAQAGVGYFGYTPGVPTDAWVGYDLTDFANLGETSCAVDASGALFCLGSHNHGKTGVGLNAFEWLPVEVGGSGSN